MLDPDFREDYQMMRSSHVIDWRIIDKLYLRLIIAESIPTNAQFMTENAGKW
jgi:hypothetical protein